jgi:hypothetical protein
LVFGVGIGLAVTAIASPNSASALATMASFLLGGWLLLALTLVENF